MQIVRVLAARTTRKEGEIMQSCSKHKVQSQPRIRIWDMGARMETYDVARPVHDKEA